jgi:copper chaperone CopZ
MRLVAQETVEKNLATSYFWEASLCLNLLSGDQHSWLCEWESCIEVPPIYCACDSILPGTSTGSSMTQSIYVLTDPNFALRVLYHWLAFVSVTAIVAEIPLLREAAQDVYFQLNDWMLATAHRYAWWSLLALLSSSCCALQIILNCMSLGCAGFNTVLGPVRPIFLSLTILVQMGAWYVAWTRPWQWVTTALSTFFILSLSFLPDLLSLYEKLLSTTNSDGREIPSEEESNVLVLKMTSVGCSACLVAVSAVLTAMDGVEHFNASVEQNQLTITYSNKSSTEAILRSLEDAGFPMEPIPTNHKIK